MKKNKIDPFIDELKNPKFLKSSCKFIKCPAYSGCAQIPIEIVGKGSVDYLFIDKHGTKLEGILKRPFTNREGSTLRNILYHIKNKFNKDFTYALGYLSRNVEEGKGEDFEDKADFCINNLMEAISKLKPKAIVILGKKALDIISPSTGSIEELHGTYRNIEINGETYPIYVTYSLGYLFKNIDILGEIFWDIAYLVGVPKPKIKYTKALIKGGVNYKILKTVKEVKKILKSFNCTRPCLIDLETINLYKFHNRILSIQLYNGGEIGYAIPWKHKGSTFNKVELRKLKKLLKKFVSKKSKIPFAIGHNLKFDYTTLLASEGIEIQIPLLDTMAGAFLLDETKTKEDNSPDSARQRGGYALGSQILKYGYNEPWYFQAKGNRGGLRHETIEYVSKYGVGDVILNWEVLRCQFKEAENQNFKAFKNILLNFYSEQIKLFTEVELNGILINIEYLKKLRDPIKSPLLQYIKKQKESLKEYSTIREANKRLTENQASIFGDSWVFSIDKREHKHLLFFDIMELEPLSFGKKKKDFPEGEPSLDTKFKKHYKEAHPEVDTFYKIARAEQLYGLYVKSFFKFLSTNPDLADGRIRPSNFGIGTRSGRGSSSEPNMQQNVRDDGTELVNIIRGLFIASPGNVLIKLDLMANEVRCWGNVAKDSVLRNMVVQAFKLREKYFKEGPNKKLKKIVKILGDIHRAIASSFLQIEIKLISDDQRQDSKVTTFGTVYGLTLRSLAESLKKSIEQAKKIRTAFFKTFNRGKKWLDNSKILGRENLYVTSLLGRRRRLWFYLLKAPLSIYSTLSKPKLDKGDNYVKAQHAKGDRRAMNTPVQADGSDFSFIGAFIMRQYIRKKLLKWLMLNVVHDSLETEVSAKDVKEYILTAKVIYERQIEKYLLKHFGIRLFIPIEVSFEIGISGNKMEKWDGAYKSLDLLQAKYVKLVSN